MLAGGCSVAQNEPTTTTSVPPSTPAIPVVLGVAGLDAVRIGDEAAVVVAELTSLFGAPSVDTGWGPGNSPVYGRCPAEELRAVGWGSFFGIFLRASQGAPEPFFTWTYGYIHDQGTTGVDPRGLDLETSQGAGLGTTRAELRALYGDRLEEIGDAALDLWSFTVDGAADEHLRGALSGSGDDAVVQLIERVPSCANLTALTTDE